ADRLPGTRGAPISACRPGELGRKPRPSRLPLLARNLLISQTWTVGNPPRAAAIRELPAQARRRRSPETVPSREGPAEGHHVVTGSAKSFPRAHKRAARWVAALCCAGLAAVLAAGCDMPAPQRPGPAPRPDPNAGPGGRRQPLGLSPQEEFEIGRRAYR